MALSDWYTKFDDRLLHDRLLHDLMAYRPYRTAIEISATTSTKEKPAMKPIDWNKPLEKAYGEYIGRKAEVIHVDNGGDRYVKYVTANGNWCGFDKVDAQGRSLANVAGLFGHQLVRNKVTKYTRFNVQNVNGGFNWDNRRNLKNAPKTHAEAEEYMQTTPRFGGGDSSFNAVDGARIVEMTWEE